MDTSLAKRELWVERYRELIGAKGYSPSTLRVYGQSIRECLKYLEEEERIRDLKEVNRVMMNHYQNYLYTSDHGWSLVTQANKLLAVKNFFKFLERENVILFNPASHLEYPKKPERLPRVILGESEMKKVLVAVDVERKLGLRDKAMLEVFYSTGIRSGEIARLDLYDVDWERGFIQIREGKGGSDRVVPCGEIALGYLREYLDRERPRYLADSSEPALFLSFRKRRLRNKDMARIVQKYARGAGVEKGVSAHTIRHSVATHMLARRAPIRYIQEMLGHKNLNTTQIYTRVEISDLKGIHKKTHPRG